MPREIALLELRIFEPLPYVLAPDGEVLRTEAMLVEVGDGASFVDAPGIVSYADGERFGPLPLTVECVPGALTVLC